MMHAVLIILQEYSNVTEIEFYSLRGVLRIGKKKIYTECFTLCVC